MKPEAPAQPLPPELQDTTPLPDPSDSEAAIETTQQESQDEFLGAVAALGGGASDTVCDVPPPATPGPISPLEDEVLEKAVQLGFITLEQAQRVHTVVSGSLDAKDVVKKLVDRGLMTQRSGRELESQVKGLAPPFPGYRLRRELGRGGMGVVYEAVQEALDRRVALKVVEPHLAPDEDYLRRFEREARTLARLNHPNIVQVYDSGRAHDRVYIALEFVSGEDLSELIAREGALERGQALQIVLDAARGLQHAWREEIIHRDIKPANLLLHEHGGRLVTKVADLGLARSVEADAELTQAGTIMGTPAYMAPEQSDARPIDFRADIYALGATLFHALTGSRPFAGTSVIQTLLEKQTGHLPDPRELKSGLDDDLVNVLDRMLARAPEDRHATYEALIADLEGLLRFEPSALPPLERERSSFSLGEKLRPSQRLRRLQELGEEPKGSRGVRGFALAGLGLLAMLGGGLALQQGGPEQALASAPAAPEAPATRTLQVDLHPAQARLFLDGVDQGHVETLELTPGAHSVRVEAEGYLAYGQDLDAEATSLAVRLRPESRALNEDPNFRLTRFPEGMRRLPPLLNPRSRRFDEHWQRVGEWSVRRSRKELAQGLGGLVGETQDANAPAVATRIGFAEIPAILRDNGAPGFRVRVHATPDAKDAAAAFEVRFLQTPAGQLVAGHLEGKTYLGLRDANETLTLLPLSNAAEPLDAVPSGFQIDWDGRVVSVYAILGTSRTHLLDSIEVESDASQVLLVAALGIPVRFHDLSIHPLVETDPTQR